MAYFYPFGIPQIGLSSSFATLATSASAASSLSIGANLALFASSVITAGDAGPTGPTPTSCGAGPTGPQGPTGPAGPSGPSLTSCPAGTKQCTGITPPTGYILVCIEIPSGCTEANTRCPGEVSPTPTPTPSVTPTPSITPTPTPTPSAVTCNLHYSATITSLSDCGTAYNINRYSNCSTLGLGCYMYTDSGCTNPDGGIYFQADIGMNQVNFRTNASGVIVQQQTVTC